MTRFLPWLSVAILLGFCGAASAQSIGGNASISASGTSANVAIPASKSTYPALLIAPATGTSVEVFYKLGTSSSVTAATTDPSLPSGGICVMAGPNTYVAAVTSGTAATVRVTQMSTCTMFSGGSGGSGGGGGGTVTQGTVPWIDIPTGFHVDNYGTPISATNGVGVTGAIPTITGSPKELVVQNVGTFGAFCKLGASSGTDGNYLSSSGGYWVYGLASETQVTCQGVGGTTTINLAGGAGAVAGTGGGGGGSGGGAVTLASGAVSSGAYSSGAFASGAAAVGSWADGSIVNLGTAIDSASCASGTSALACWRQIDADIKGPIQAGSALIGGTNLVDSAGTIKATVKAGSTPATQADTAIVTALRPATPQTPIYVVASDNHQVIKNGAGTAFSVATTNNSATPNYLRLYDAGTGFNGCNSATNLKFSMEIPPSNSGFSVSLGGSRGYSFTSGISICVTSAFGATDTTAATASAITVNVGTD